MKIHNGTFYGRGDTTIIRVLRPGDQRAGRAAPRADDTVEVNPLLPAGKWDWLCLDNVRYHGRILTVLWDRTGKKFGKGKGLSVFADGRQIGHSSELSRVTGNLHRCAPAPPAASCRPAIQSLLPQGHDGLDLHGASRREIAGCAGDHGQQERDGDECQRISGGNSEKET